MQHKTLSMDLDREPLHTIVLYRLSDIDIDHVPVTRSVIERFSKGVVVEVAIED
jgi:hypothetical protein